MSLANRATTEMKQFRKCKTIIMACATA